MGKNIFRQMSISYIPEFARGFFRVKRERIHEKTRDITELRLSFSGRPIKSFHLLASWVKDTSRWFSMLIIQTNIYTYYKMNKVDDSPITLFL